MYCIDSIHRNGSHVHFINIPADNPDAPILFMSHGFPDNAFGWDLQISEFKGKYHIIAPFMHGTLNNTEVSRKRIRIVELIRDVTEIVKQSQTSPDVDIYLLGHDLGCFLNTTLYLKYPHRVKGIINLNGLPLAQYFSRKINITQWLKSYYIFIAQLPLARYIIKKVMPGTFLNLIYDLSHLDKQDDIRKQNDERVFKSIFIYRLLFFKIFIFFFIKPNKITAPTLFVWGNKDVFLNIPTQHEADKHHTNSVIRVVQGGHWVLRSNHKHVNRILHFTLNKWESDQSRVDQSAPALEVSYE